MPGLVGSCRHRRDGGVAPQRPGCGRSGVPAPRSGRRGGGGQSRAEPGVSSASPIAFRRLFAAGASAWFLVREEAGRGWMVAPADKGLLSKKLLVVSNFGSVLSFLKGHV